MKTPASIDRILPIADDAWLIDFGGGIDDASNACAHALAASIRTASPRWLRDLVPAYASLGVFFDRRMAGAIEVREWLLHAWAALPDIAPGEDAGRTVEIPVLYGGQAGVDLASAAAELGLSPQALVQRHAAADYRVAMIGFAPGFPYLSGLDPALALPRLATPRAHVPAGSVAIGGTQTGIYPLESPGGWRLLGRTPVRLFDPMREPPSLLAPGDHVRFRVIDADAFDRLERGA